MKNVDYFLSFKLEDGHEQLSELFATQFEIQRTIATSETDFL